MKLVSYLKDDHDQVAFLINDILYDCDRMHPDLPITMAMFLNYWEDVFPIAHSVNQSLLSGNKKFTGISFDEATLLSPVPHPVSFRKMYLPEVPELLPEMIFLNHNSFCGAGDIPCKATHLAHLGFDAQLGIVIVKPCKNITAAEAADCIGGFMILNNLTAHSLQQKDAMPFIASASGRDFATAAGPLLITTDELETYLTEPKEDYAGKNYALKINCSINDVSLFETITLDLKWTFEEMIAQCSYGVQLYPGDVISTGISSLFTHATLAEGDIIKIEIEGLDALKNTIVKED